VHLPGVFVDYDPILRNGISIGMCGIDGAGSFGGYVKLNEETFGLSCSHCVTPDTRRVDYKDVPQDETSMIESPAKIDYDAVNLRRGHGHTLQ
jgi:hypothetical protein